MKSARIQKTGEVYEVVDSAAGAPQGVSPSIREESEEELRSILGKLGFSDRAIGRGIREANQNGRATITRGYGWNSPGAGSSSDQR